MEIFDIYDFLRNPETLEKTASVALSNVSEETLSTAMPENFASAFWAVEIYPASRMGDKQEVFKKFAYDSASLTELNINLLSQQISEAPGLADTQLVKVAAQNLGSAAVMYGVTIPENVLPIFNSGAGYVNNEVIVSLPEITEAFAEKTASENVVPQQYALPDQQKYKITTAYQVDQAAHWFDRNATKLAMADRIEFAYNLSGRIDELGLREKVSSYQLAAMSDLDFDIYSENLPHRIESRIDLISMEKQAEYEGQYRSLLKLATELDPVTFAQTLEHLDVETGISRCWNTYVPDPVVSTFGQVKYASDGTSSEFLSQIPEEVLVNFVDADTARDLKGPEGLAIYDSLPIPVKSDILKAWK